MGKLATRLGLLFSRHMTRVTTVIARMRLTVTDPNVTYKTGFAELVLKLGRLPTANEILPLNIAYAKSWGPAEETLSAPDSAAGPQSGFSREPAPQARTGGEGARTRETVPDLMAALEASLATIKAERGLSGPTINAEPPERRSAPEPPANNPGPPDGLIEGDRGPGGGLMCKCQVCGLLWERPRSKGRPAYRCETCRN